MDLATYLGSTSLTETYSLLGYFIGWNERKVRTEATVYYNLQTRVSRWTSIFKILLQAVNFYAYRLQNAGMLLEMNKMK